MSSPQSITGTSSGPLATHRPLAPVSGGGLSTLGMDGRPAPERDLARGGHGANARALGAVGRRRRPVPGDPPPLCSLSHVSMSPSRQPPTKKNKMGDRPGARSLVARLVSTEQYYWQYLAVRFLPARPWPAMGPRR